ncbi:MAG: G-Protein alpha subunit [Geoglossum umbratile]|nr:MAG: G-Protein alpha subunit [Geoglossum umbratile]
MLEGRNQLRARANQGDGMGMPVPSRTHMQVAKAPCADRLFRAPSGPGGFVLTGDLSRKGAGESGKSTILKQMKLIYASGFSGSDRDNFRCIIFSNILHSLKTVLAAMEAYSLAFELEENEGYRGLISLDRTLTPGEPLPMEYLAPLKSLWADKAVRRTVKRGNEYALHDNLSYFFQDLDRLFAADFVPSNQDVLRSRLKTTGITETIFDLGKLTYRMFDVGGQRSERKKWIHCFENVNCVLFLVAISGYDQCLVEEMDGNQMQEAFMLFESISNSRWFTKTSLILFLNKMDLFRAKLESSPVTKYFPDYQGDPKDATEVSQYFRDRFLELSRDPRKEVYTHFTNATDTDLLGITMASVQNTIIQRSLNNMYFA